MQLPIFGASEDSWKATNVRLLGHSKLNEAINGRKSIYSVDTGIIGNVSSSVGELIRRLGRCLTIYCCSNVPLLSFLIFLQFSTCWCWAWYGKIMLYSFVRQNFDWKMNRCGWSTLIFAKWFRTSCHVRCFNDFRERVFSFYTVCPE